MAASSRPTATPAAATSATAAARSPDHRVRSRASSIADQEPSSRACRPNISRSLVRLVVVVPEQVQDAVGAQEPQLCRGFVPGVARLRLRDRRTEHDVTEQLGSRRPPRRHRSEVVHREGQHVRRTGSPMNSLVQARTSPVRPRPSGRQLGLRMDPHLTEHELRPALASPCSSTVDARLVVDGDGHRDPSGTPMVRSDLLVIEARVGLDDVADQPVPHDVARRQLGEVHVVDALEDALAPPSARWRCPRAGRSG